MSLDTQNGFRDEYGPESPQEPAGGSKADAPEPPAGFDEGMRGNQEPRFQPPRNAQHPDDELFQLRKITGIAQILALVSLIIGGVVLSTVALVVALVARSRVESYAQGKPSADTSALLMRRQVKIAIIMSVAAMALNAISLVLLYPMMMEMLQSGELGSFFDGGAVSTPSTGGSSTWG